MGVFGASFVTAAASLRVATQQNSLGPIKYHRRVLNQFISQSCRNASLKICASFSLLLVPIEDMFYYHLSVGLAIWVFSLGSVLNVLVL